MARKTNGVITLTFVIYESEDNPGRYVAHCLEMDIVAVEDNVDDAIKLLKELVEDAFFAASERGTLGKIWRPAPPEVWQRLEHAQYYKPSNEVKKRHISAGQLKGVDYSLAGAT